MEAGGFGAGTKKVQPAPGPTKAPVYSLQTPSPQPVTPPKPAPTTQKPPIQAVPATNSPAQVKPKPVNPSPVATPITTPGPGTVKQLVNFYDSQGKASPIRPYSYSQAVKQG